MHGREWRVTCNNMHKRHGQIQRGRETNRESCHSGPDEIKQAVFSTLSFYYLKSDSDENHIWPFKESKMNENGLNTEWGWVEGVENSWLSQRVLGSRLDVASVFR